MSYKIIHHKNDIPADFLAGKEMAIDTETMGLNLSRDRLCVLQFSFGNEEVHVVQFLNDNYDCPNLKKLLADANIIKIFHYARFDVLAIYKYLGIMCENNFCTKIASKMSRTYTSKHGLKELVREIVGIDLKKEQQTSYWGSEDLSEAQLSYAASDVLYLHALKEELIKRLIREKRYNLAKSCFGFLPTQVILDDLGWDDEKSIFSHQG